MPNQRKVIESISHDALMKTPYVGLESSEIEKFFKMNREIEIESNALLPEDCLAAAKLEEEIYQNTPGHIKGYESLLGLVASCYVASTVRDEPYLCFKANREGEISAYIVALYGNARRTKGRFFSQILLQEFGHQQCIYVSDWQAKSKWDSGRVAKTFFRSYGEVLSAGWRDIPVLAHARVATSFSTVAENMPLLTVLTNKGMRGGQDIEALHVHSVSDISRAGEALRGIIISNKKIGPDETGP